MIENIQNNFKGTLISSYFISFPSIIRIIFIDQILNFEPNRIQNTIFSFYYFLNHDIFFNLSFV